MILKKNQTFPFYFIPIFILLYSYVDLFYNFPKKVALQRPEYQFIVAAPPMGHHSQSHFLIPLPLPGMPRVPHFINFHKYKNKDFV